MVKHYSVRKWAFWAAIGGVWFLVGAPGVQAREPRLPDVFLGRWCPAGTINHPRSESESSHCTSYMIVTPSKVLYRGGDEEGECRVRDIRARAKAWKIDFVCYGEVREVTKEVWSVSGTRLIVDGVIYVRKMDESGLDGLDDVFEAWNQTMLKIVDDNGLARH